MSRTKTSPESMNKNLHAATLESSIDSKSSLSSTRTVRSALQPYLDLIRFDKPTGTVLIFWPFAWGLTMAAYRAKLPLPIYGIQLLKCFMTAFIVRSSGCTVNDIFDRNVDGGVARTRKRPLPSGRITLSNAILFLVGQYVFGSIFVYFTTNDLAFWTTMLQMLPLAIIYPLMKRVTHWPQAWLGIAMNFGVVPAWLTITGSIDVPLLSSWVMCAWSWTMVYDTIYACQDKKDDLKMGVKSTAILFGSWIRPILVGFGLTMVTMMYIAGVLNNHGPAYFLLSVGGVALHLIWQYKTVDLEDPASCWKNFNRNGQLGWVIWGGLAVDYLHALNII